MIDPLRRAALRLRIPVSCTDCIATSPLRYHTLSADGRNHIFSCCTCGTTVLFDRVSQDFKRDDAGVSEAGGARHGGPQSVVGMREDITLHNEDVPRIRGEFARTLTPESGK